MAKLFSRNPEVAGLWVGSVRITHVAEAAHFNPETRQYPEEAVTPVGAELAFSILMHVDDQGAVRLLKDVILLRRTLTSEDENAVSEEVLTLLTDEKLLVEFDDINRVNGKMVANRIGTGAFDFDKESGNAVPNTKRLTGGLGAGLSLMTTLTLSAENVTNPFFHKYHPDLRKGYDLKRKLEIDFAQQAEEHLDSAGFGVSKISGNYQETVEGLHKVPLFMKGHISLRRICKEETLNQ
jgi:hypothetical protein